MMQSPIFLAALLAAVIAMQYQTAAFSCNFILNAPSYKRNTSVLQTKNIHRIHMSPTDGSDASADIKIQSRKNRVVIGYKAMNAAYLTAGMFAAKASGLTANTVRTLGGYIALPAGISYILISAAVNNRLGSDTYKRLNLAMIEYSALGIGVVILGKGRNKILALAFLLSLINSIKGYAYGVLGLDKKKKDVSLMSDISAGTVDTIEGFLTMPRSDFKAIGYFLATAMMASFKVRQLVEVVQYIKTSRFVQGLAIPLARFNRLALITLCLYTLKDAADRGRLGGTTFIELNYLCAVALGVHAAYFTGGLMTPVGAASAVFALFCGFNGVSEYMKKK